MKTIYQQSQWIDHYQIIGRLGYSSTSHLYLAQDWRAFQSVMLKVPVGDLAGGTEVFTRYVREREMGKRLSHPTIQRYLNQEEQKSSNYLVLEYLHGNPLRAIMQKRAPELLPQIQVLRIMEQVCTALIYVHEQGVIHQNIKPEHIFLLETEAVKLLDFGIAQLEGEKGKWQRRSRAIGTPDYMAPERLAGKPGTPCSDVYAVGIVLYELLYGRTPFEEGGSFALINQHLSNDPPDILQFRSSLSPSLATVVMRAIRRNPNKRYGSIQALLYDLHHLDQVTPRDYAPDPPLFGGSYRQILHLSLIVLLVCLALVSSGILAQLLHQVAH